MTSLLSGSTKESPKALRQLVRKSSENSCIASAHEPPIPASSFQAPDQPDCTSIPPASRHPTVLLTLSAKPGLRRLRRWLLRLLGLGLPEAEDGDDPSAGFPVPGEGQRGRSLDSHLVDPCVCQAINLTQGIGLSKHGAN